MRKLKVLLYTAIFAGLSANNTHANIAVDKSIIDIVAGQTRRADIYISNPSDSTQHVNLEISRILNPGTEQERRVTIDNPRELGVIVTPSQFSLEAGEWRKARISFIRLPKESDLIYRLLVSPDTSVSAGSKKAMIQVVFNYDVLISHRPPTPKTTFTVERSDNSITFTNTGNSNFLLYAGEQCEARETNCRAIPAHRMYAGNSHTFKLHKNTGYIRFLRKDIGSTQLLEYQ